MSAPAAYLAVVVIWSTTPLAVKWSAEGAGFLLGAVGRMGLAAVFCLALTHGLRLRLPFDRTARRTYAAASIAVYGAMLCVYWASQYVPSGLIAVLFGLTPFVTALFARWLLDERGLTARKLGARHSPYSGCCSSSTTAPRSGRAPPKALPCCSSASPSTR